jgi:hypothetical protein
MTLAALLKGLRYRKLLPSMLEGSFRKLLYYKRLRICHPETLSTVAADC